MEKQLKQAGAFLTSVQFCSLYKKIKYAHLVSIEYEEWENDPLPSVAETVGFTRGLLVGDKKKKTV